MNKQDEHLTRILFSCAHQEQLQMNYTLTAQSLQALEHDHLPTEIIARLKEFKATPFLTRSDFLEAVEQHTGTELFAPHKERILHHATPLLLRMLHEWGYATDIADRSTFVGKLQENHILVLGAPKEDIKDDIDDIRRFMQNGGGLLLLCNSEMLMNPLKHARLHELIAEAGIRIQEYHNNQPGYIQIFHPHYITANIKYLRMQNVASVKAVNKNAYSFAFMQDPKESVAVCAEETGKGRVVAVGDVGMCSDSLLLEEHNARFVQNIFLWLSARNPLDIKELHITKTVDLGDEGTVELLLQNNHKNPEIRPDVECILDSDSGAIITEPVRQVKYSIPQGKETLIKWGTVTPQKLGVQQLRLLINISNAGEPQSLYFDQLSEDLDMRCMAPGYLTLEIREKDGNLKTTVREGNNGLKTTFRTGEYFTVEGAFHWASDSKQREHCHLKLDLTDGLIETGEEIEGFERTIWYVKVTAPGTHEILLRIPETGQELPALVRAIASTKDQIAELNAAYVYPLDAEIAERLRQVAEQLSCAEAKEQPFTILAPEEFVREIYKDEKAASWLQGVLVSANREQWHNPNLVDLILTYFAPTYLANVGSFIPYDPHLACRLAELHPFDRKNLESNLLWADEKSGIRENMSLKQNIAVYLLHEKYGHGFFYTQTRLGQQLAILLHHGFPEQPDEQQYEDYRELTEYIKDSAFVVNEGFAAWMELTFLKKLDREVQQVVYSRHVHLIQEARGLSKQKGKFFNWFPRRYDSPYREGYEYLEFIGRKFSLRCALRVFLFATQVEFGITENTRGAIQFLLELDELKKKLAKTNAFEWCSHIRLQKMTDLLYEQRREATTLVRNQNCPDDCLKRDECPLMIFIADHLYNTSDNF